MNEIDTIRTIARNQLPWLRRMTVKPHGRSVAVGGPGVPPAGSIGLHGVGP